MISVLLDLKSFDKILTSLGDTTGAPCSCTRLLAETNNMALAKAEPIFPNCGISDYIKHPQGDPTSHIVHKARSPASTMTPSRDSSSAISRSQSLASVKV